MTSVQPSTSTNNMSLKGREMSTGESIIMPIDISTLATTRSMITNGMKIRKPDQEGGFQLARDKRRDEQRQRHILRGREALAAGDAHERRDVALAGLVQHELLQGHEGAVECDGRFDGAGGVGLEGVFVDALDDRRHDEEGQEQRQADQHLVGRRLAGAERLAQDAQHDDDAREGGHHEQDGRQQGERRHQHQDLQCQRVGLAATAAGAVCTVRAGRPMSAAMRAGGSQSKATGSSARRRASADAGALHLPRLRSSQLLEVGARVVRVPRAASSSSSGSVEHVQSVDAARGDAEQDLLRADFQQDGALFLAQRNVGEDVDGTADAVVETAHAAGHPGNGEDRGEHEQQRERDFAESADA